MDFSVLSPATLKGKRAARLRASHTPPDSRYVPGRVGDGWCDRNLIGEVGARDKALNNGV